MVSPVNSEKWGENLLEAVIKFEQDPDHDEVVGR